jgi:hypothetical protein
VYVLVSSTGTGRVQTGESYLDSHNHVYYASIKRKLEIRCICNRVPDRLFFF